MADRLRLPSSLLLGNPIPESYHAVGEELQEAVLVAVRESVENGMSKRGKEVTPWLLQRVAELSKGKSLDSSESNSSLSFAETPLTNNCTVHRQGVDSEQCTSRRRSSA